MVDSSLIDLIYEAGAVPDLWPQVLAQIAEYAGAWGAGLLVFDPSGHMRFAATDNYVDTFSSFAANADKYDNQRPKRALASGHTGFLHDLEVFTQDELDCDPVYRDFIYRFGLKWTAGTVIPVPTRDLLAFDICRLERQGAFDRETMLRLDQFRPHLARAALLAHRLGLRAARAATEAMETIGVPAAALDAAGRVITTNNLMEGLSPQVKGGAFDRLHFANSRADGLLRGAVAAAASRGAPVVQSVPIPAWADHFALVAHVLPVRRAAGDIFARATALVVFTPVSAPTSPLAEVLTGLFDLSPAEARVARGVASGLSLADIARMQNLSRETVRTQLKSVLLKTGTTRQVELALLLSGTATLPRGEPERRSRNRPRA